MRAGLGAGRLAVSPTSADDGEASVRPPDDFRLVPAALLGWAASWTLAMMPAAVGAAGGLTALLLAAAVLLPPVPQGRRRRVRATVAAALVGGGACALSASAAVASVQAGPVRGLGEAGATARVEAVVTADPRRAAPSTAARGRSAGQTLVVEVRVERVTARGVTTGVRTPVVVLATSAGWSDLLPGTRVAASGRLAASRSSEAAALLLARGDPTVMARAGPVQRAAGRLRAGLRRAVQGLPPAERGLVPGLVVGDTSALPPELEEDFRTAGLTHLVAVSGANVAIVCGAALVLARRLGAGTRSAVVVAGVALAGFVVLARPQPSVLRAGVMGAIALAAVASGRRGAAVPGLAAAVLGLLLVEPTLARSYGFALSVLATAGIVLLAGPWTQALRRRGVPLLPAAALAVPAAAQLACGPVVAMLAGSVSLVAVPANLLVAPAVAPATLLGVAAVVVATVSPPLAALIGHLAGVPAAWIVWVARAAADVPHAAVGWPSGPGGGLALAVTTMAVAALVHVGSRRPRLLAAVVGAAVVAAGLRVAAQPEWPPRGWVAVACDVGQGDALVLRVDAGSQQGESAVVVDAGPDPGAVDRCLRRLDVRTVPLVLLTHMHADHVDGLAGVLRGRAVGEVEVGPLDEPGGEARGVFAAAAAAGARVTRVGHGEVRSAGSVRWEVLWPRRVVRGEGSAPNNASIVMVVETGGLRLLLTGDVELAAQRAVTPALRQSLGGVGVDVLKVPHHGSAVQSPEFLAAAGPRIALVSSGADNPYGHPAPATLSLLAAGGAGVWRTDLVGDIAVLPSGSAGERVRAVARGR